MNTRIDKIFAEFGRKCSPVVTLRNVDNPMVRREYIDDAKHQLYLAILEVIPEELAETDYDGSRLTGNKLLKPEYINERIWGWNKAINELRTRITELFEGNQ